MSEPVVFFGLGVLVVLLLIIGTKPFLHSRLGLFALKRLESAAPSMMADIEADMEQLHSQIAVATRRLEMGVEQMKLKTTGQLAEIARGSEAIGRLKAEHAEKAAAFAHLQERERTIGSQLRTTEAELKVKSTTLQEVEQMLADRKAEFTKLMTQFDLHPEIAKVEDRHRIEMEGLQAEKADVEEQLRQSLEERLKLQEEIDALRKKVETTWASERMANAVLRERINDVASEVVRVAAALEGLTTPIETLVAGKTAGAQSEANGSGGKGGNGHGDYADHGDNGDAMKSTLVHRIRALRKRNSEAPAAS
jgi:chromosome segregation ATPase